MNADYRSLGKVFSIAICRQSGDKRLSKALFLAILDSRSSIVNDFDCLISEVFIYIGILNTQPKQSETRATRNNLQSDKLQSKSVFLTILDLHSSIVLSFLIAPYVKCLLNIGLLNAQLKQSETRATRNNLHFSCSCY